MRGRTGGVVVALVPAAGAFSAAHAVVLCAPKVKKTGELKEGAAIKLCTACKSTELQLDPAALGLQGPAGQDGADGAPGSPGSSGVGVVVGDGPTVTQLANGTGTATASCPGARRSSAEGSRSPRTSGTSPA
jgi:hypothetical protein